LDIASWEPEVYEIPTEILALAEARTQARLDKNWALSDEIRDKVLAAGFIIEDTREGAKVKKA
ncbi:MAG: hypothetical protein JKY88_16075, partial [Pseudomonadales bacterium]|nr:hypothetical protein [Pseudomonadales bacterium]